MKNIERKLEIGDILTPYKFANTLSREANRGGDTFLAGLLYLTGYASSVLTSVIPTIGAAYGLTELVNYASDKF
tara:strand:- start:1025 stop:1246 length:222 start_codon:yes stop_codon:yes gene_type:complete